MEYERSIFARKLAVDAKNCPTPGLSVECASLQKIMQMAGKSNKTPDFEAALTELEQLVASMESGKLSLEDSLAAYKRGAELLQQCRARLEDAQQQVRVLEEGTLKAFQNADDASQS